MANSENPLSGKVVSWQETWMKWMLNIPFRLRRNSENTRPVSRVFNALAKGVRAGTIAVHHAPEGKPLLPFPEKDDGLYGPADCHIAATTIMDTFDAVASDANPALREALEKTLTNLPDRKDIPGKAPRRRRNGRWHFEP